MIELSTTVRVRRSALKTMLAHARATPARECCGALLGRDAEPRSVECVAPLSNEAVRPRDAYLIDAHTLRGIERDAHAAGLQVVGFYHSHPDGPALPSGLDLESAWPWFTYVILGRARDVDVAGWRLRADRSGFQRDDLQWIE